MQPHDNAPSATASTATYSQCNISTFHKNWWFENLPPRAAASLILTLEKLQGKEASQCLDIKVWKDPKPPTVQSHQTVVKWSPDIFICGWNHLEFYLSCMCRTNSTGHEYCPFRELINLTMLMTCPWKRYYNLSQKKMHQSSFWEN